MIRFNGVGDFNPHHPKRSLGRTFLTSNVDFLFGGNRLLLKREMPDSYVADWYLVVLSQELHGRMELDSDKWKSSTARVIAASQLRQVQEVMLLMKPGDWIRTLSGIWQLVPSSDAKFGATLGLQEAKLGS